MSFKGLTLNTPPEKEAHILAEDDAAIYEALLGDDRVLDIGNKLGATVITNNSVRISDGVAVVGGHVGRIIKGDYQDMTIQNGTSGKKRNDLICARFITNGNTDTYNLVVVKGAAGSTATDPSIVRGNLYAGDKQRDFPLWRVCLDGLSITKVQQMFSISETNKNIVSRLDELNRNIQSSTELPLKSYNKDVISVAEITITRSGCNINVSGCFVVQSKAAAKTNHFNLGVSAAKKKYFPLNSVVADAPVYGYVTPEGYIQFDTALPVGYYFINFTFMT